MDIIWLWVLGHWLLMGLFNLIYHNDEEGEGIDSGKEITSPQFYKEGEGVKK